VCAKPFILVSQLIYRDIVKRRHNLFLKGDFKKEQKKKQKADGVTLPGCLLKKSLKKPFPLKKKKKREGTTTKSLSLPMMNYQETSGSFLHINF